MIELADMDLNASFIHLIKYTQGSKESHECDEK